MAALHALHPARLDRLRARAAAGAVFKAASCESELEAATMDFRYDHRRSVSNDHPDMDLRLASV